MRQIGWNEVKYSSMGRKKGKISRKLEYASEFPVLTSSKPIKLKVSFDRTFITLLVKERHNK